MSIPVDSNLSESLSFVLHSSLRSVTSGLSVTGATKGRGGPLSEVRMVQSRGARGLQLAGAQSAPSFPASQIFNNCDFFPGEFSIVVTFNIPRLANKVRERGKKREIGSGGTSLLVQL